LHYLFLLHNISTSDKQVLNGAK